MELTLLIELFALELAIALGFRLFKRHRHVFLEDGNKLVALDDVVLFHPLTSAMLQTPVDAAS